MKIKLLNRDKEKDQETKQVVSKLQKEKNLESPKKDKNLLPFSIPGFQHYSALMKLRIVVGTIFFLCTISMILIFANVWEISAVLLFIGYIMLLILMLKLLRVKSL
jgi:hypothetical protein